jgi:hypothetical protein
MQRVAQSLHRARQFAVCVGDQKVVEPKIRR